MRKREIDHMNRIRAVRGLPPMTKENMQPEHMMERARAAVCFIGARNGDPVLAVQGFMEIFHPGHPQTQAVINAVKERHGH